MLFGVDAEYSAEAFDLAADRCAAVPELLKAFEGPNRPFPYHPLRLAG
jgi:hypothetical protein